jgi:hypothetical protein
MLLWLQAFLIDGMESLSQAKVGSALQVFFNLEQLQQVRRCCSNATRCTRQQTLAAPAVLLQSPLAAVEVHQVFFNLEQLQQVSWCCSNATRNVQSSRRWQHHLWYESQQ